MSNLSTAVSFGSQATEIKLTKKISELNRIQVIIASNSDMAGIIVSKEFYPNFFARASSTQIIARYSPTACIKLSQSDESTFKIWSNAQMAALGFPETMYCVVSGF